MADKLPTVRSIAAKLGISRTTVSEALRGSPRVKTATARRICRAAHLAGYHRNPLAGAVMSEIRRSHGLAFRGVLAVLNLKESDRPSGARRFHADVVQGVTKRAAELGFKAEEFLVGSDNFPLHRLDVILQARGINGLILLPAWKDPDLSFLDWNRYAGVYTDYIIQRPPIHAVCPDHFRSMMMVMHKLEAEGFQRPGLFLQKHHDERLQHRWQAAYTIFLEHHPHMARLPVLLEDEIRAEHFQPWFKRHQPDVVLGHTAKALEWMAHCGAHVPKTHSFVSLNVQLQEVPCAGLDLQPSLLGASAAELVIAQLHRNERGIPGSPMTTTIPSVWVDGPTLRTMTPAGRR